MAVLVRCGCCGRPVPDHAYVCPACAWHLHEHLVRLVDGDLVDELDTALARQAKLGGSGGRHGDEQPLAFGYAASEAIWVLRNTLTGWVRVLLDDLAHHHPPADTLPAMAEWLAYRTETLRHLPEGPEAVDELTAAVRHAEAAVAPLGDRVYVGPCAGELDGGAPCGADLYAAPGAAWVTCKACGAHYRVHQRREWLLDAAEDVLETATEIARAVTSLGRPVTPERIRQWAHRGQLHARGTQRDGRGRWVPLYRVGDVLDLVADVPVPAGPACADCAHGTCRTIRARR
ncbi:hypothetical protein FLW53_23370 [Microbispora sp. SCL1-1]|uniref:hypothetical protein n=1 Tax=unclassified Microbispora TaxID=2614687 RepID=UPI00115B6DA7|nr:MULTISPECIES: hypothetical protein [unclassified Microbispora]NJP27085.1 hypothetical protein [Microbispora sp. CL1-1]TQS11431.1 hypothetical protein FLW53_23370 [Microbispora sp. SCL1-1]